MHIIAGQKPLMYGGDNYRDMLRVVIPICKHLQNKDSNVFFDMLLNAIGNYSNFITNGCPFKANVRKNAMYDSK